MIRFASLYRTNEAAGEPAQPRAEADFYGREGNKSYMANKNEISDSWNIWIV